MIYTFSSLLWLQNFEVWGLGRDWIWISMDANTVFRCPRYSFAWSVCAILSGRVHEKATKQVILFESKKEKSSKGSLALLKMELLKNGISVPKSGTKIGWSTVYLACL